MRRALAAVATAQAVIGNAQLAAAHELLDGGTPPAGTELSPVVVTQQQLEASTSEVRGSVTPADLQRYMRTYEEFAGKGPNQPVGAGRQSLM